MSITYPLTPPGSPAGYSRMTFMPESAVAISESPFTFAQQVQAHPGQKWHVSFTLPPVKRSIAEPWLAFFLSLNGRYGTFLLGDPTSPSPRGVATGSPLVNGGSQSGQSLVTDGWTPSITGILKAGDYIQLGSGSTARLHRIMVDVNSNGSGQATLDIWPRLRTPPADNAVITLTNTVGVFRLASDKMQHEVGVNGFYTIGFEAEEVL